MSRLACVGSDSLFQSVVSSGVGHTVTLLHAVRGPAHPEMDIAVHVTLRRTISPRTQDRILIGNSRCISPELDFTAPLAACRFGSILPGVRVGCMGDGVY